MELNDHFYLGGEPIDANGSHYEVDLDGVVVRVVMREQPRWEIAAMYVRLAGGMFIEAFDWSYEVDERITTAINLGNAVCLHG
jgi:hypothetical protein